MEARISRQRPTRLLKFLSNGEIGFADLADGDSQPYAILSHTWREDGNEITFGDLKAGTAKAKEDVYKKLKFCGDRAAQDRLKYFWVDTCCINKSDVIEVQHAINCMFRWYRNAAKCYVYLSDVAIQDETSDQISELPWESEFQRSRWFTRGWTLQELLAPQSVEFFSQHGVRLGDKRSLEHHIHARTRIPITALRGSSLSNFTVGERMSWINGRQTKYEEDKAYSLQGIFDIFVLPNYGEGEDNAFARLREEINKRFSALQLLPVAEDAIFNSYRRQHEPTCLPDTRVGILHDIHAWADGTHERVIYWLNGLAGTGKSTIARTIARHYFEKKRLGASFFFTRGGGDVGNARKFFTTIASQLAHNVPTLNQYVCNAIAEQSNIASLSLDDQWRQLILNPLLRLAGDQSRPLFVLVIDALDECGDDSNVRLILNLLVEARRIRSVRLRIFLTSRPDVPIRHGFYQMPDAEYENLVLHNISPSIVDHDISIFLEYNLTLIRNESSFDSAWPSAETIRLLIWTASGLFIWAATACRFIHEGKQFATRRLEMILTGSKSDAGTVIAPEKHLNDIYSTVLKHSVSSEYLDEEKEELYNMLRRILGSIVTLISPLSAYSLGRLLDIPKKYVDQTLEDLHSILDVPRDQARPLRLHHPSFRDFLLDHERCEDPNFWVDEKQAHQKLADSCIRLMSTSLKQEICGIDAPGTLVADVEISRIQRCLPPEVQYACLYWIQHVQRSGIQHRDNDQVHQFLLKHLLHWLEAVTWMGKVSEAIYAIISLDSTMDVLQCPRLSEYVHDIKRFVLYHRPTIEHAPLQIYSSALIFTPSRSFVRSRFIACIPPWVRKLPKIAENWNALLQTLEGHSDSVSAVAFSPDGKLLASGSGDKTVKLWEASSSTLQRTLEGHSDSVSAVAFSPDGKLLASGSHDKTVKLWDIISGTLQRTLEGHSWIVNAVAFSPDGKLLASGSHDKTVKLWDASSGTLQRTLKGHSREVKAVAFSPDGKLLASGSWDNIVKLWDASLGTLQRTLKGHSWWVNAVAFSPDGKLLASGSHDDTVKIWEASSGTLQRTLKGHSKMVSAVAFSPDGKLLASGSWDNTVRLWDASSDTLQRTLEGHSDSVSAVAFSPDGKLLASGSGDNTVKLWDASSGTLQRTFKSHSWMVNVVAFSLNDKLLASGSHDDTVKLWDASSGTLHRTLEDRSNFASAVAFSPNDKLLASGSWNNTVKLWDASSGTLQRTLEGHSGGIIAVAFSPDGKLLASGSWDNTVKLWDASSGTLQRTLEGHSGGIVAVAFSPDGKLLASGSIDDIVKLWDASSGTLQRTLEVDASISTLSFSNDGTVLKSNRGLLLSSLPSDNAALAIRHLPSPVFIKAQWVTDGTKNLLWLPSEYRPDHVAIHESTVAFGHSSGRVSLMNFAF